MTVLKMTVLSNINKLMKQIILKNFLFTINPLKNQKIKRLKNIDLLAELSFYEKLNIMKTNQAFRGYAMS